MHDSNLTDVKGRKFFRLHSHGSEGRSTAAHRRESHDPAEARLLHNIS
jgi:hypothetical protein